MPSGRDMRKPAGDAAGFVLAGGMSSRMGRDKALLELGGQPLIIRALGILRDAGLDASIAGARTALESFAPVIADREPGLGPLSGICAALRATPARWAVFLSVDAPLLPASLVAYLVWHAQITEQPVTIASVSGFAQTLPAVVDRAVLPVLEAELREGHRGCFAAFELAAKALGSRLQGIPTELLVQGGQVTHAAGLPALHWFLNVNAPQDLERAASLLHASDCVSW